MCKKSKKNSSFFIRWLEDTTVSMTSWAQPETEAAKTKLRENQAAHTETGKQQQPWSSLRADRCTWARPRYMTRAQDWETTWRGQISSWKWTLTDVLQLGNRKNQSWGALTKQLRKTQTRISEPVLVAPEKPSGKWILRSDEIGAERRHLGARFLVETRPGRGLGCASRKSTRRRKPKLQAQTLAAEIRRENWRRATVPWAGEK
jgi:hypothetical protein